RPNGATMPIPVTTTRLISGPSTEQTAPDRTLRGPRSPQPLPDELPHLPQGPPAAAKASWDDRRQGGPTWARGPQSSNFALPVRSSSTLCILFQKLDRVADRQNGLGRIVRDLA